MKRLGRRGGTTKRREGDGGLGGWVLRCRVRLRIAAIFSATVTRSPQKYNATATTATTVSRIFHMKCYR